MNWRVSNLDTMVFSINLKKFLTNLDLNELEVDSIMYHVYTKNYLQVLFDHGKSLIVTLLRFYEEEDYFEECIEIQKEIKDHNKATGEQIDLKK